MFIQRYKLFIFLLFISISLLYGPFLSNPLVFDDTTVIAFNQPFSLLELRSLPYSTVLWTQQYFGLELFNFRIFDFSLHIATTVALFGLMEILLSVTCRQITEKKRCYIAFCVALLFAWHPVSVYCVAYLAQRSLKMATLFGLLCLWSFVYGSVRQKVGWVWMSVLFSYLALFSKEHAVLFPLLLIPITYLIHENWVIKLKENFMVYMAHLGIMCLVFMTARGMLGTAYEPASSELLTGQYESFTHAHSILSQSWFFFKYITIWLFPNPLWMSIDIREPLATEIFSVYLFALLLFCAWGGFAIYLLRKRSQTGMLGLGLLAPWLLFLTEFSTLRIQEPFVLYRCYLWMPLFCCVPILLLAKIKVQRLPWVAGMVTLFLVVVSYSKLTTFSHPILLWTDAINSNEGKEHLPWSERAYFNRAVALAKTNLKQEAINDFSKVLELHPNFPNVLFIRSGLYMEMGRYAEAISDLNQAIVMQPNAAMAYVRLGEIYEIRGDANRAKEMFARGCALDNKACIGKNNL